MPKDNFSKQSQEYARYRPTYPQELYTYILSFVKERVAAWDCACGNGQATLPLSDDFTHVFGTDISAKQIAQAPRKDNITYVVCPAEETPFSDNQFDLITVAQAYHWLNWEAFEKEARRVGKNRCVIAVWMYDLLVTEEEPLNELIRFFYKEIVGPYWDAERTHIDHHYKDVLFNFESLPGNRFALTLALSKDALLGYFNSWSATQHYLKANGHSPLETIIERLDTLWLPNESKSFTYPIYLRLGILSK